MGMSWGDYGALEGAGLRGTRFIGERRPQPAVFTGPRRVPAPPSALVDVLSGAAVSPHQQEPTLPGSPAVPPLTEAGGTTAHDPAAAPLSALTEGVGNAAHERRRWERSQGLSPAPSVSALTEEGTSGPSSDHECHEVAGFTHPVRLNHEVASPSSVSASDRAYTLPPKAGMVPPVPRATGRAQVLLSRMVVDGDSGCWEWAGWKSGSGYGLIKINKRTRRAHRVACETFIGPVPPGLLVCHHCDNPPCINPKHLFVGTQADNMGDALRKGRIAVPANRALDDGDAGLLRDMYATGAGTLRELASAFGISKSSAHRIVHGECYPLVDFDAVESQP